VAAVAAATLFSGCGAIGARIGDGPDLTGTPSVDTSQPAKYVLRLEDLPDGWATPAEPPRASIGPAPGTAPCPGLSALVEAGTRALGENFASSAEHASSEIHIETTVPAADVVRLALRSPAAAACIPAVVNRVFAQNHDGLTAGRLITSVVAFPKVLEFTIDFRTTSTVSFKGVSRPAVVDVVIIATGRVFALLAFTKVTAPGDLPGADDGLEAQAADAVAHRILG
jgi:hypothetical protein